MLSVTLRAFNDGTRATVRVKLTNTSSQPLGSIDLRAPIPRGMALLDSSPPAQLLPDGRLGWIFIGLDPGQSVTFRYRLETHGLAAPAQATAVAGSVTYISEVFPIGSPTSPPPVTLRPPDLAPVPKGT
jgi:hypothetical protein